MFGNNIQKVYPCKTTAFCLSHIHVLSTSASLIIYWATYPKHCGLVMSSKMFSVGEMIMDLWFIICKRWGYDKNEGQK